MQPGNVPSHTHCAAIIGSGRGWHTIELQRALTERGVHCDLAPITGLQAGVATQPALRSRSTASQSSIELDGYDVVLVRIVPRGSLEQTIFRMDALHLLEERGVRVFNCAKAIERTVDKYYTSGLLAQAGLPTPRTIVCEKSDHALEAFAALGGDVVVKPLFGSMGLGLIRIESEDVAYRVFKALELEQAVYYVQEYIAHQARDGATGRDIRAFVLGDRVLASMERLSESWRTNFARGAQCRSLRLTADQEELCLRAARVVGTEYAGVDLLPADNGELYVVEVNGIPGWKGLQATGDLDIAGEIADYLIASQDSAPERMP
ncbi:MAG: RimK family alpha-L-glutamate ligase [Candidatus Promineifilaceae bacterium]